MVVVDGSILMTSPKRQTKPKGWDAKERVLVRPTSGGVKVRDKEAGPHKTAALPKRTPWWRGFFVE